MSVINLFAVAEQCKTENPADINNGQKDTILQLVISLVLGTTSFISFCLLRPRWKSLYAARKQPKDDDTSLPELPDTFFGWMPVLWNITEEQVLSAAGLDAFVFLSFFKMAIKFLSVTFLLAAAILAPINNHFVGSPFQDHEDDSSDNSTASAFKNNHKSKIEEADQSFVWAYLIFTYVFTALALYFLVEETKRIIRVRQDYLGSQSTITDRTIKLSGIPQDLRSEKKIEEILEKLEIGKVESVTICRNWKKLDDLMDKRAEVLRKLEESWAVHLSKQNIQKSYILPRGEPGDIDEQNGNENGDTTEDDALLANTATSGLVFDSPRPMTKIRYGTLKLRSRKIDAIDYYEEQLRQFDEKIGDARKAEYPATALAFVTMDSIPACQMAVQALLDPAPMQLLATPAPAPSDVVWSNTYPSRSNRMARSWSISIFVWFLTIVWLVPVASLAALLSLCTIEQVAPRFAESLSRHDLAKALVQTGLPTLVVSLLNVAIPYLYYWLSTMQGFISQSEVELSVISKNFDFTFFNFFIVFTVFASVSNILPTLQESLKDTTQIAYTLARSLKKLGIFYTNFILLQGVGLFPLRLLEFGVVSTYPIMRMGAKTPRDFAELVQPPVFSYGFYLPTAILIYILCIVYSILPAGFMVLLFGLLYFIFGYFTYKYQLLYAMDHPQHATGRAWSLIVYRILIGLGIFQLAMAGVIALQVEFTAAGLVLPLIIFVIWFSFYYRQTYEPLTKFIALRSIRRTGDPDVNIADEDIGIDHPPGHMRRRGSITVDEAREKHQRFINPSLNVPLEGIWIDGERRISNPEEDVATTRDISALGYDEDANVWGEDGSNSV